MFTSMAWNKEDVCIVYSILLHMHMAKRRIVKLLTYSEVGFFSFLDNIFRLVH